MAISQTARQEVHNVLSITLALNIMVAIAKIILGMLTGIVAITADGFHSLTDSAGNIAGLIGNYYAGRPADENHPYGHGRFETLSALLIGALLLLTAWELMQTIVERLQQAIPPQLTPIVFIVLIVTLIINIAVSSYQMQAGKRLQSAILLADAQNTRADVFVTMAVLASTAIMALTGWLWVDIVSALVVVGLIGKVAWGILKQTGEVLVDTAPYEADELHTMIADIDVDVVRARSRGTRQSAHIDIDVRVPAETTTGHTNFIAQRIRQRLNTQLQGLEEVEVHFIPYSPQHR